MYERTNKRVKVVAATTAEEFESKLNSVLDRLNEGRTTYDLQLNPTAGFVAFITYNEYVRIAETISEEFEIAGEHHRCEECPFFTPIKDKRLKHTRCQATGKLVKTTQYVCDEFYKELMGGANENESK